MENILEEWEGVENVHIGTVHTRAILLCGPCGPGCQHIMLPMHAGPAVATGVHLLQLHGSIICLLRTQTIHFKF